MIYPLFRGDFSVAVFVCFAKRLPSLVASFGFGDSDPAGMDSDGDGYTDDDETSQGTDPNDPSDYPGSSDPTTMDSDGDGLSDDEESSIGTNPNLSDSDGDGLSDYTEHNGYTIDYVYFDAASQTNLPDTYGPLTTDPNNPDSDGDLLEDGWEVANSVDPTDPANGLADGDGDGLSNGEEVALHLTDGNKVDTDEDGEWDGDEITQGTDPLDQLSRTSLDSDGDVMSDDWEALHGLDSTDASDASVDSDGDTLTNFQEYLFGSDPQLAHSDSDGYDDGLEWSVGTDPLDPSDATLDSDGDGAPDLWEALYGFDYGFYDFHDTDDSDGDGLSNSEEYNNGYNPTLPDTDGDGISDYDDFWGTGPQDSDGDGLLDDDEINTHGTDPNDVDSDGDELTDYAEIHGIEVIITSGGNSSIVTYTTNPLSDDSDGDGLNDKFEIENFFNPNDLADGSGDDDADGLTTAAEVNLHGTDWTDYDTDGDREKDGYEITQGTDPLDALSRSEADSDGDLMSDAWETSQGLNPADAADANTDLDGDGLTNLEDFQLWAFANNPDSDGDGYQDGFEVDNGKDPADPADATDDSDGDGMPDLWELTYLLDPNVDDADGHVEGDGLSNLEEFLAGTDPNDEDSDDDGRNDGDEVNVAVPAEGQSMADAQAAERYTDPTDSDTDNDGFPDGYETVEGLDPLSSSDGFSDYDGDSIASGDEFEIYQTDWRRKDTDGDGEWDNEEIVAETDPSDILSRSSVDSDGDHMSDVWEAAHGLDASADDGSADEDNDGLENYREYVWRTNPHNPDHDNDGYQDGFERDHGFDPSDGSDGIFDGDGDQMPDLWEITHQLDHNHPADAGNDEEPDLLSNLAEFQLGTDPRSSDSDSDWLADGEEHNGSGTLTNPDDNAQIAWVYALDPADADTDGDGEEDGYEIIHGSDPTDSTVTVVPGPVTSVVTNGDGSTTTTITYVDGASDSVTNHTNGDVATTSNHGDGSSNTQLESSNGDVAITNAQANGSSITRVGYRNGETGHIVENGDGTSRAVTEHEDSTTTLVVVDGSGATATSVSHGDGTRTVTVVQADGTSTTVTEFYDADIDGIADDWELANGLDPNDADDAGLDFDYDRLSNLLEYRLGTEANTDWDYVEIGGGLPVPQVPASYFHDAYGVSVARQIGPVTSLRAFNDIGQIAKVDIETAADGAQLFRLKIWTRGEWQDSHSLGQRPADSFPAQVAMNNFGMVVLAISHGDSHTTLLDDADLRIVESDGTLHLLGSGELWSEFRDLRVTDTGYLAATVAETDGADSMQVSNRVIRWRAGELLVFEDGVGEILGISAPGEILHHSYGLYQGEAWHSFDDATPQAISEFGVVLLKPDDPGTGGYWSLDSAVIASLFVDNWGNALIAHSPIDFANDDTYLLSDAVDPDTGLALQEKIHYIDWNGEWFEIADPDAAAATSSYQRAIFASGLNNGGDVSGWFVTHPDESGLLFTTDDPNSGSTGPQGLAAAEAFLWRRGDFSLLGGIGDSSRFWAVSDSGHILVQKGDMTTTTEVVPAPDPNDADVTVTTTDLSRTWGVLFPGNDSDEDGLANDWERYHGMSSFLADGDNDADELSNLQEFVYGSDPHQTDTDKDGETDAEEVKICGTDPTDPYSDGIADSDGDELNDGDEVVLYGTSAYLADSDGDGLSDSYELNTSETDALDDDSDGDGEKDGDEVAIGTDPNDATDNRTIDSDSDEMPDYWEERYGLDPLDPEDAGHDEDFDRITNLQEYEMGTEPIAGWIYTPLTEISSSGENEMPDIFGSLNDLGQMARISIQGATTEAAEFFLHKWTEGEWSDPVFLGAANGLNQSGAIRQNNFGLVAAVVHGVVDGVNKAEIRIMDENWHVHILGQEQNWQSVSDLHVTDSGFVAAKVTSADAGNAESIVRWWRGRTETLTTASASFDLLGLSERGEVLDKHLGVYGIDAWSPVAAPAAISRYGEILQSAAAQASAIAPYTAIFEDGWVVGNPASHSYDASATPGELFATAKSGEHEYMITPWGVFPAPSDDYVSAYQDGINDRFGERETPETTPEGDIVYPNFSGEHSAYYSRSETDAYPADYVAGYHSAYSGVFADETLAPEEIPDLRDADTDADGISDFAEYRMDTDPASSVDYPEASMLGLSIGASNQRGDFVGWSYDAVYPDDGQETPPDASAPIGNLWHNGELTTGLIAAEQSQFWNINEVGHILLSRDDLVEQIEEVGYDTDGDDIDDQWIEEGNGMFFPERSFGLLKPDYDADDDGLADDWEAWYGVTNPYYDEDEDGLNNLTEFGIGTSPIDAYTTSSSEQGDDNPRISDRDKLKNGVSLDPSVDELLADFDGDGLNVVQEVANRTTAVAADTDGDGVSDDTDAGTPEVEMEEPTMLYYRTGTKWIPQHGHRVLHGGAMNIYRNKSFSIENEGEYFDNSLGGDIESYRDSIDGDDQDYGDGDNGVHVYYDWIANSQTHWNYEGPLVGNGFIQEPLGENSGTELTYDYSYFHRSTDSTGDVTSTTVTADYEGALPDSATGDELPEVIGLYEGTSTYKTDEETITNNFSEEITEPIEFQIDPATFRSYNEADTSGSFTMTWRSEYEGSTVGHIETRRKYSGRIDDQTLKNATSKAKVVFGVWQRTGWGGPGTAQIERSNVLEGYNSSSDPDGGRVRDAEYQIEVEKPHGQTITWLEAYVIHGAAVENGAAAEMHYRPMSWKALSGLSPVFRLGGVLGGQMGVHMLGDLPPVEVRGPIVEANQRCNFAINSRLKDNENHRSDLIVGTESDGEIKIRFTEFAGPDPSEIFLYGMRYESPQTGELKLASSTATLGKSDGVPYLEVSFTPYDTGQALDVDDRVYYELVLSIVEGAAQPDPEAAIPVTLRHQQKILGLSNSDYTLSKDEIEDRVDGWDPSSLKVAREMGYLFYDGRAPKGIATGVVELSSINLTWTHEPEDLGEDQKSNLVESWIHATGADFNEDSHSVDGNRLAGNLTMSEIG